MQRIDLILHPVRIRLLQALAGERLTTQELAERLPDVPKSSIYRHLRLLLDEGMIAVAGTRPVRGVVEKEYRLAQPMRIGNEEMKRLSAAEHIGYFQTYLMTLIQGFGDYVAVAGGEPLDMAADRAGYTEVYFFATPEELDQFAIALNDAIRPLAENPPRADRRKHKLAVITHPVTGWRSAAEETD